MKHTKSVRTSTASVANVKHAPSHSGAAIAVSGHGAPVTKAAAHAQAATAHSVAAARHKAAAVSGVGSSAEHQAALAYHNMAVAAHQTAANTAQSGVSSQDASLAGRQALQASAKAEGYSRKALAASGNALQAVAAHQASTQAAQSTTNAITAAVGSAASVSALANSTRGVSATRTFTSWPSVLPLLSTPEPSSPATTPGGSLSALAVSNTSKQAQKAAAVTRQTDPAAATPAGAARQFVAAATRSAPLRHLWKKTATAVVHLPLRQQMNKLTALLNRHGFKTTALHVIQILGSSGNLGEAIAPEAERFVNRMLANPRMTSAFSRVAAKANNTGGLQGAEEALRRFLKERGYTGRADHFQHALSYALVSQGRQWIGQYDKTQLIVDGKRVHGPSLTVENSPSGLIFRLNGKPLSGVTTAPASEYTTRVTWPATGGASPNGVAGTITFSRCKARDKRSEQERYHGPAFTGTLTFVGPNAYGIDGKATFQGVRTGAVIAPSPAKVA